MPEVRPSASDTVGNIELVKKYVGDRLELEAASTQQIASIREAVEKKSVATALQLTLEKIEKEKRAQIDKEEELHEANIERIKSQAEKKLKIEIDNLKKSGKTEEELQVAIKAAREESDRECRKKVEKANSAHAKKVKAMNKDLAKHQKELQDQIAKQREEDEARIHSIAAKYAENQYKQLNVLQRANVQQQKEEKAAQLRAESEAKRDALNEEAQLLEQQANAITTTDEKSRKQKEALLEQARKTAEEAAAAAAEATAAAEAEKKAKEESASLESTILDAKIAQADAGKANAEAVLEDIDAAIKKKEAELQDLNIMVEAHTELGLDTSELESKISELNEELGNVPDNQKTGNSLKEKQQVMKEIAHQQKLAEIGKKNVGDSAKDIERQHEIDAAEKEHQRQAEWAYLNSEKGQQEKAQQALSAAVNKLAEDLTRAIDQNINDFYQYQAHVMARLQGSDINYKKALLKVSANIGISGVVSQKEVIQNIKTLSDAGVAYNLELRAFLGTISDKIANTFDAFDANLLRLIRVQQADSTAARLGLEAALTKYFNQQYQDTSYLSDVADTVRGAIFDATAQLNRDEAASFEYTVQKWMGSLYSLGFSSETLTTIAQGINYLGTGNVEALSSNDSLNNLLAMASARAGISYADVLIDGLDSATTNKLLKSIVEYLQSIANNTDNNQVTKAAYSNVFGMNMTDLRSIQNLSSEDVSSIYNESLSYDQMVRETNQQLALTLLRVPVAQMMDTAFENAMAGASTLIGSNIATYGLWKVLNVVEGLTGGIAIPAISIMGSGVDLNTTIVQLAKLGVGGLGLMGSLLGSLFSGGLFGTFNVNQWGLEEYTKRGQGLKNLGKGQISEGFSESSEASAVGSASSSDMKANTLSEGTAGAEEDSKITNENTDKNKEWYENLYDGVVGEDFLGKDGTILSNILDIKSVIGTTSDNVDKHTVIGYLEGIYSLLNSGIYVSLAPLTLSTLVTSIIGPVSPSWQLLKIFSGDTSSFLEAQNEWVSSVASMNVNTVESINETALQIANNRANNILTDYITPHDTYSSAVSIEESTISGGSSEDSPLLLMSQAFSEFTQNTASDVKSGIETILSSTQMSSVDQTYIADLIASTEVSKMEATTTEQTLLRVCLEQMSPEVSAFIASVLKNTLTGGITGTTLDREGNIQSESLSLADIIVKALQSSSLNVQVQNEYFDSMLLKSALSH